MKKLIFTILVLIPLFAFSQDKTKVFTNEQVFWNVDSTNLSELDLQIEFIRFCRYQEFKQRKKAYIFSAVSATSAMIPLAFPEWYADLQADNGLAIVFPAITYGFALLSAYNFIASERWNFYSSYKPELTEVGVRIRF